MMGDVKEYSDEVFENIKHIDEFDNEYWLARELQLVLEYSQWRRFENVIKKSMTSCGNSYINTDDHFADVGKMVDIGSKTKRKVQDYKLSRYACYLIVMNGNPKKEIIALGQTYFAVQTRKSEFFKKEYHVLTEDEKRLYRRTQARKRQL